MKYLGLVVLWALSVNIYAGESQIESLYKANNVYGSILIESADGKQRYQYNVNNKESFIPASTFKIPNTLIILEEGLVKDPTEVIAWDGIEREYSPWNKDQTLKTAFQYSCVWCYQRYAKIVGDTKYHEYLRSFNYGNQLTGCEITRFWLDGDLRVSVKDQISFLRKVYDDTLPVKQQHIKTLKDIMLSENDGKIKIWSKTGWSGKDGWYVGYLVYNEQTWFFANHIEINQRSDLALRKKLTMDVFKALKIVQQ
ncbi:penicillin-binding transpeptidase domain-containing protein [Methylophaga sp.]|uniref:penicillin-binding transpeptidase domain-containing protein n=1 Tax=Methylophaga sp. TaxID=2024840 RepID=UPI003F69932B